MKLKHLQKMKRREARKRLFAGSSQPFAGRNPDLAPQPAPAALQHPIVGLPIYYSDLMDRVPPESEIDELVSSFARKPTFFMLAMLNTFISFFEKDRKKFTDVQGFLFQNLTDEEMFERARQRFPHEQMGRRPLFLRQQMLTLMKKVLLLTSDEGETDPNTTREGKYALGQVALMTTDLLDPKEQAEKLLEKEGVEGEEIRVEEEFCTQMLPSYEMTNPPDVLQALVRNDEFFKIFERMAAQGKFIFSNRDSIAERFLKLTGLKLKDYLLLIFALYLNYQGVAQQDDAISVLINDPSKFNVGIDEIFQRMKFTTEERRAFFEQTSTDVDGLTEACRTVRSKFSLLPHYDFTAFRTYPLIYTRDKKDIVTCLDASFLAEKISTGVYYTIKQPLEVAAGESRDADKDHRNFLGYWGGAFEIYVNDRLQDVRSPGLRRIYGSTYYDNPPEKSSTEAFDAVLDYGRALVVFEHKGKYLELGAKYSGERELLLADLRSDKRIGKGIYQLADNLQLVFNNHPDEARHTFHERAEGGQVISEFGAKEISRIKRVYPVIVHQDFSLRLNCVNRIMDRFFQEEIAQRKVDQELVRPLTLLTVEDLENVIPYLTAIPLPDILEECAGHDDPLMTFERIFRGLMQKRHTKPRRYEWIHRRSEEIWREIKELFIDLSD